MIVGTTAFKLNGNPYYSPQFSRGGLAGTFTIDVTHVTTGLVGFTVTVEHRNAEDTSWTTLASFTAMTAVAVQSIDATGCKEVLRFKYTFDATDTALASVHFLMQAPSWRPY